MTQPSDPRIQEEFRKRRTRQLAMIVPALAAVIVFIWADDHRGRALMGIPSSMLLWIGGACFIGVLVFSFSNWRCPACNGYLGKGWNPKFCVKCGVQLRAP